MYLPYHEDLFIIFNYSTPSQSSHLDLFPPSSCFLLLKSPTYFYDLGRIPVTLNSILGTSTLNYRIRTKLLSPTEPTLSAPPEKTETKTRQTGINPRLN